jgi:FkbM family methyltransferase
LHPFAKQVSDQITFAVASLRRRYLYALKAQTVGGNTGVIRDNLKVASSRCDVSFRYKSVGDRGVVNQIFQHKEYAVDEASPHGRAMRKFYDGILAAGQTPLILDAGANIGASCLYFSCVYPGSDIVAIEPERNNCALLKHNTLNTRIRVLEGAIGSEQGTICLSDPGLSDWGFRVAAKGEYEVPVYTPNQILADYPQARYTPLLFKIDIEGFEEQLFSRDLEWLDRFPMIVIELHDWMLPGSKSSRPFLRAIASREFDFTHVGENVFCFNTRLLSLAPAAQAS